MEKEIMELIMKLIYDIAILIIEIKILKILFIKNGKDNNSFFYNIFNK